MRRTQCRARQPIAGLVALHNEKVDISLAGQLLERARRPTSGSFRSTPEVSCSRISRPERRSPSGSSIRGSYRANPTVRAELQSDEIATARLEGEVNGWRGRQSGCGRVAHSVGPAGSLTLTGQPTDGGSARLMTIWATARGAGGESEQRFQAGILGNDQLTGSWR